MDPDRRRRFVTIFGGGDYALILDKGGSIFSDHCEFAPTREQAEVRALKLASRAGSDEGDEVRPLPFGHSRRWLQALSRAGFDGDEGRSAGHVPDSLRLKDTRVRRFQPLGNRPAGFSPLKMRSTAPSALVEQRDELTAPSTTASACTSGCES